MKYQSWLDANIADLTGKTILITGANHGLGFFASKQLAYKGAHILMACRNEHAAREAIQAIHKELPTANLTFVPYDQGSFASIQTFVNLIKTNYPNIDIMLLNAGIIMPKPKAITPDGLPLTTGVNFFNVYVLLRDLLGFLDQRNPDIRLVLVGSYSAYKVRMSAWKTMLNPTLSRMKQYALSKLGIAMLHHVFQMNLNLFDFPVLDHISAILVHPGLAKTNITHQLPSWLRVIVDASLSVISHSAESGALSLTYACGHAYLPNGSYVGPSGPGESFGLPTRLPLRKHFSVGSAKFTYEVGKYLQSLGGK
jgi:NAD(P)-dependent dehydrogenase (short-subunit alcohol dehydrogenase family)